MLEHKRILLFLKKETPIVRESVTRNIYPKIELCSVDFNIYAINIVHKETVLTQDNIVLSYCVSIVFFIFSSISIKQVVRLLK